MAEIERLETNLKTNERTINDPEFVTLDDDAVQALAVIDRIERRWAANTMSTKPKEPT